jgi:hypothetical protein
MNFHLFSNKLPSLSPIAHISIAGQSLCSVLEIVSSQVLVANRYLLQPGCLASPRGPVISADGA